MRRGEVIGEIMRRSVLGERRDIPQTGATKIDQLFYWGNAGLVYVSHGALDLRVDSRKTSDASKTGVIEKSRDGQDFLCTGRHHVIQGHGGPLPALH
jgi:hypothetical protein